MQGDAALQTEAIARSVKMKAEIVVEDEREKGRRALLNLGHTFGHAIEAHGGYDGRILHGEAVSIGMVMAARLSAQLGLCDASAETRLAKHLKQVGLPTLPQERGIGITAERMVELMGKDKKVADNKIVFILLKAIGQSMIHRDVPIDAVTRMLSEYLQHGDLGSHVAVSQSSV